MMATPEQRMIDVDGATLEVLLAGEGEPVVCTPRDALESFWSTPLDALAIGSFIIEESP